MRLILQKYADYLIKRMEVCEYDRVDFYYKIGLLVDSFAKKLRIYLE